MPRCVEVGARLKVRLRHGGSVVPHAHAAELALGCWRAKCMGENLEVSIGCGELDRGAEGSCARVNGKVDSKEGSYL